MNVHVKPKLETPRFKCWRRLHPQVQPRLCCFCARLLPPSLVSCVCVVLVISFSTLSKWLVLVHNIALIFLLSAWTVSNMQHKCIAASFCIHGVWQNKSGKLANYIRRPNIFKAQCNKLCHRRLQKCERAAKPIRETSSAVIPDIRGVMHCVLGFSRD